MGCSVFAALDHRRVSLRALDSGWSDTGTHRTQSPRAETERAKPPMRDQLTDLQASYPARPRGADDRWWQPASLGGTAPTLERAAELDAVEAAAKADARAAKRAG